MNDILIKISDIQEAIYYYYIWAYALVILTVVFILTGCIIGYIKFNKYIDNKIYYYKNN